MQSFLIVGSDQKKVEGEIDKLVKKYSLKKMDFEGAKIDQIRKLNAFVSLSLKEKTAIIVRDIDKSTTEAMNAFLKNLEEPQDNLFFVLTSKTIHKVLPTITSRCQVIISQERQKLEDPKIFEDFIKMKTSHKLAFLDKIKQRNDAIDFFYNLVVFIHQKIKNERTNFSFLGNICTLAETTLSRLEKNGNVSLQLTNFAINSDNFDTFT